MPPGGRVARVDESLQRLQIIGGLVHIGEQSRFGRGCVASAATMRLRTAATTSATWSPPTSRPPAISEPNSATPMTLPVWRAVLSVPDAMPERERSTLPSRDAVITGTISPSPSPSR